MRLLIIPCLSILLGACASMPPEAISHIPAQDLSLTQVRLDIDRYTNAEVRWGGLISKVENKAENTWIEIVRHPLQANGRPKGDKSDGRFIASFDRFVDPIIYTEGRPLTVVGKIEGKVSRTIGEFDYTFPIVAVEGSFLWKTPSKTRYYDYPPPWWYYDPWLYHPWPYHRHPRHH